MRILLAAALLAAACSQAQPKPAPEATREAAGQRVDAGQQAANEPGGSAMGTEDAGARQAVKDAADAGQQAAADAGQDVAGGIKQGASEAAGNVASGTKEAAQNVAQGASEAGRAVADAGAKAVSAAGSAASDLAEALQKLPPPPAIPDTPMFLPAVEEPRENPTTPEKVWLGYELFFDKRLSKDGSMSCESCHHPEQAWTSGNATDPKVGGGPNKRNAPTMENVAYYHSFYWDGRAPTMEAVSAAAWKGQLGADPDPVVAKLNAIGGYRARFQRAFKEDATGKNVPMALAAFLRALKTGNAPWGKFEQGEGDAVSMEARRGYRVFQKARCTLCHVPPLYTDAEFHNVGVGYDKPEAERDHGRMDASKDPKDDGKFKTPTLRDIAKTAPYFHDGSVSSLSEAVDFMVKGGIKNPNRDEKLKPSRLSAKDRKALQAFLESLTGTPTYTKAPELP
ncbi:MAG TPA: cytochrome c peroxidase [Myxococcales bacterium]|nr:cytochrome c peroxidase [Myxococcales bacterium]